MPTLNYSNTTTTANGIGLDISECYRDVNAPDYCIRTRWTSTNAGYFGNSGAFAEGSISKMTFKYKAYGASHTNFQFVVQFKAEGGEWAQAGGTYTASNTDWVTAEVTEVPAGSTYFRIQTVAPPSGTVTKTGNFDDIGLFFGTPVPTLSYTGATTITLGQAFNLVFTLNGATASGWQYTFESATRQQVTSGSVNTFSYTPSSTGTYYLTMTALDEAVEPIATRELTLTVLPMGGGTNMEVTITGDLTGTVGEQMNLTIALQNGTASEWTLLLRDPDTIQVNEYTWNAETGAYSFTPEKEGTYVLSATALDEGWSPLATKSENLVVGGGAENPPIAIVLVKDGTGDFQFTVPDGHALARVEGTTPTQFAANVWTTLTQGTDYTVTGTTVRVVTSATRGRIVRIVMTATR